jgi:hypothetical protein
MISAIASFGRLGCFVLLAYRMAFAVSCGLINSSIYLPVSLLLPPVFGMLYGLMVGAILGKIIETLFVVIKKRVLRKNG